MLPVKRRPFLRQYTRTASTSHSAQAGMTTDSSPALTDSSFFYNTGHQLFVLDCNASSAFRNSEQRMDGSIEGTGTAIVSRTFVSYGMCKAGFGRPLCLPYLLLMPACEYTHLNTILLAWQPVSAIMAWGLDDILPDRSVASSV